MSKLGFNGRLDDFVSAFVGHFCFFLCFGVADNTPIILNVLIALSVLCLVPLFLLLKLRTLEPVALIGGEDFLGVSWVE